MCSARAVEEIRIKVPWGHIAGKWWGSKDYRPIVALHGRADNAGTFDRLIPLLPNYVSYLAIDLPGHGYSSRIPDGQMYNIMNFVYLFHIIREHYNWDKISVLAHSISGIHACLYAAMVPDKCDMIIILDTLPTAVPHYYAFLGERLLNSFNADIKNQMNVEPFCRSYDEILNRLAHEKNRFPIDKTVSPCILSRGLNPGINDPTKFYLNYDRRMHLYYPILMNEDLIEMAKTIKIPICFIRTTKIQVAFATEKNKANEVLMNTFGDTNPNYEGHVIDGGHHIHLECPEKINQILNKFIAKCRNPAQELIYKL